MAIPNNDFVNIYNRPTRYRSGFISDTLLNNVYYGVDTIDTPVYWKLASHFNPNIPPLEYFIGEISIKNTNSLSTLSSITILGNTYTASLIPTDNNHFLLDTNLMNSLNSLANRINNDLNLNWKYTVNQAIDSGGFTRIFITAKYYGSNYNLNNINVITTGNIIFIPTPVIATNNNRGQIAESFNYKIFIEIWMHPTFSFDTIIPIKLATLTQAYNGTNDYTFEISQYLRPHITKIIPDINQQLGTIIAIDIDSVGNSTLKSYYLRYGDSYTGGFPITNADLDLLNLNPLITNEEKHYIDNDFTQLGATESRIIINGIYDLQYNLINPDLSISNNINPGISDIHWNYINNYTVNLLKIMSIQPEYKLRRYTTDPEYITFLDIRTVNNLLEIYQGNPLPFAEIRLKTIYTYYDGTTSSAIYSHQTLLSNISRMITIMDLVSTQFEINHLSFGVLTSSHVIEITFNGIDYSEYTFTWHYEWDLNTEPINYMTIYWENHLGCIDSFTFEGQRIEDIKRSYVNYQQTLISDPGNHRNEAQNKIYQNSVNHNFKLSSGYINKDHYEWLQWLLKSNRVWFISGLETSTEFSTKDFTAIKIIDHSYNMDRDAKLYNLDITFTYAISTNTKID